MIEQYGDIYGDIDYPSKRSGRAKVRQQGSFSLIDYYRRPLGARYRLYERIYRQDITMKSAIHARTNSIVSTIGEPLHDDPEIASFLNYNIKRIEDVNGKSWQDCLEAMENTKAWAGASISEPLFEVLNGSLMLKDIVTYHPNTITIYPDKKGMLSDGEDTLDGYHKSGIYQYALNPLNGEQRLNGWKVIYLANEADFGNYYGQSDIAPAYKWVRLKEAVVDMMAIALDKAGKRMPFITMGSYPTNEMRYDPATGEQTPISTLQLTQEQIDNAEDGLASLLLLPNQGERAPSVGSIQLTDNVGNIFLDAIAFAESMSIQHIIPRFLTTDSVSGNTGSTPNAIERRMEIYYDDLDFRRNKLTSVLAKKVLTPLIQWNFNRESAMVPPSFARVYSDRPEDRVATMQMIKGLVEVGTLNPRNEIDWSMMRQMVRCADRAQTPDDLVFIKDVLIEPRTKGRERDVKKTGTKGRPTGNVTPQQAARE